MPSLISPVTSRGLTNSPECDESSILACIIRRIAGDENSQIAGAYAGGSEPLERGHGIGGVA